MGRRALKNCYSHKYFFLRRTAAEKATAIVCHFMIASHIERVIASTVIPLRMNSPTAQAYPSVPLEVSP